MAELAIVEGMWIRHRIPWLLHCTAPYLGIEALFSTDMQQGCGQTPDWPNWSLSRATMIDRQETKLFNCSCCFCWDILATMQEPGTAYISSARVHIFVLLYLVVLIRPIIMKYTFFLAANLLNFIILILPVSTSQLMLVAISLICVCHGFELALSISLLFWTEKGGAFHGPFISGSSLGQVKSLK